MKYFNTTMATNLARLGGCALIAYPLRDSLSKYHTPAASKDNKEGRPSRVCHQGPKNSPLISISPSFSPPERRESGIAFTNQLMSSNQRSNIDHTSKIMTMTTCLSCDLINVKAFIDSVGVDDKFDILTVPACGHTKEELLDMFQYAYPSNVFLVNGDPVESGTITFKSGVDYVRWAVTVLPKDQGAYVAAYDTTEYCAESAFDSMQEKLMILGEKCKGVILHDNHSRQYLADFESFMVRVQKENIALPIYRTFYVFQDLDQMKRVMDKFGWDYPPFYQEAMTNTQFLDSQKQFIADQKQICEDKYPQVSIHCIALGIDSTREILQESFNLSSQRKDTSMRSDLIQS